MPSAEWKRNLLMADKQYSLVVLVDRGTLPKDTQEGLVAVTNRVEDDLQLRQSSQRMGRSRHIRTGVTIRRMSAAAGRR